MQDGLCENFLNEMSADLEQEAGTIFAILEGLQVKHIYRLVHLLDSTSIELNINELKRFVDPLYAPSDRNFGTSSSSSQSQ